MVEALGVYVHFPWCEKKCPYCDFLSLPVEGTDPPHAAYADAVLAELDARASEAPGLPLGSIFFGGGTPSLWEPRELGRVAAGILARFGARPSDVEITAECNPSSFDARTAEGLGAAGVNRVSLGVQGLNDERLRFLGRVHDANAALAAVRLACASGFRHVSADLIFGVAGQSSSEAADEALRLVELGIDHLSAYALTIEPGTRFGELARRGRLPLLEEDGVADSFAALERALEIAGFAHYEISNYARPGGQARHNLGYWRAQPYLGLGVGAVSTLPRGRELLRSKTFTAVPHYFETARASRSFATAEVANGAGEARSNRGSELFAATLEILDAETQLRERLMLGLRLEEGLDLELAERTTGALLWTRARRRAFERWRDRGALLLDGTRLRLARNFWLLADRVIGDLL